MDQEIKTRWLAALRSGEYRQGQQTLRYEDPNGQMRYCCLGVLCELAVADGVIGSPFAIEGDGIRRPYSYGGESQVLPLNVMTWAELRDQNPDTSIPDRVSLRYTTLAELNDDGWTFEQIANQIERDL